MSEIIKTNSMLNEFLRIISEEAVRKSLEDIEQNTQQERIKQFETGAKIDQLTASITKTSKEKPLEEDDDDAGEDLFAKSKAKQKNSGEKKSEKAPEEKHKSSPEPEAKEPAGAPDEPAAAAGQKNITFSMIKDRLNTIRSGRSLRDKEIRQNLKTYFKELSDEEQQELHTLLDNVANILTAGIEAPADSVQDDDDDDDDDTSSEEKSSEEQPEKEKTKTHKKSAPAPQPTGSGTGVEDTSPPIDVGRKQRIESLRLHVKNLMN